MEERSDRVGEFGSRKSGLRLDFQHNVTILLVLSWKELIFKLKSESFMDRGADISWLSAFPAEAENLYPPLTYLRPTGRREVVKATSAGRAVEFEVVEVTPSFGS